MVLCGGVSLLLGFSLPSYLLLLLRYDPHTHTHFLVLLIFFTLQFSFTSMQVFFPKHALHFSLGLSCNANSI